MADKTPTPESAPREIPRMPLESYVVSWSATLTSGGPLTVSGPPQSQHTYAYASLPSVDDRTD